MDKVELAIARGEEAARMVASPIFNAAFEDTRRALLDAIASLDNLRDERAAELHGMVRSLAKVRRCVEEHINTGKLARKEIEGRKGVMNLFKQA